MNYYSEETVFNVLTEIQSGKTMYSVSESYGIPYSTIYRWIVKSNIHEVHTRKKDWSKIKKFFKSK